MYYGNGLVQDCNFSSVLAMEILCSLEINHLCSVVEISARVTVPDNFGKGKNRFSYS